MPQIVHEIRLRTLLEEPQPELLPCRQRDVGPLLNESVFVRPRDSTDRLIIQADGMERIVNRKFLDARERRPR